jgi:hypothetical protein
MWTIWKSKECVGSSYVQWLLLVESARQDLGLQQENPNNQYDPAVISPMWASVVHIAIISVKPTREWFVFDLQVQQGLV